MSNTRLVATEKNVNHDQVDCWIESELSYVFPLGLIDFDLSGYDNLSDFINEELLPKVIGWSEEDNGVVTAIYK